MATHNTISADSKDYHTKAQANLRLSSDAVAMLRALASFYGLGMNGVVEMLVRERIHEKKINVSAFLKPAAKKRRRP